MDCEFYEKQMDSLSQELLTVYQELSLVYDLADALGTKFEIEEIVPYTARRAREAVGTERCEVFLEEGDGKGLKRVGESGEEPSRLSVDLATTLIKQGRSLLYNSSKAYPLLAECGYQNLLVAPLRMGKELLGGIALVNKRGGDFTSSDQKLISALANQTAIALSNAQYFKSVLAEREKLNAVITNIADGIVIVDTNWQVMFANRSARNLLNIPQDASGNLPLWDYLAPFSLSRPQEEILRGENKTEYFEIVRTKESPARPAGGLARQVGGQAGPVGGPARPAGGPAFYVAAKLTRISDSSGHFLNGALTLRDITQEKLEERMKRDFLSLISHKLRTPIGAITFGLGLLQDKIWGELNEEQQLNIEEIAAKAEELKNLVEELLVFTSMLSKEVKLSSNEADLRKMIDEAKHTVARKYKKPIELNVAVDDEVKVVKVDQECFSFLLTQILDNAVKFNDKETAVVEVKASRNGEGMAELAIADNGPGIPHEDYDHIFSQFYQVEEYFTGNVQGAGLGLALAKRIIEAHGGDIRVNSRLGQGTEFTVRFPIPSHEPMGS